MYRLAGREEGGAGGSRATHPPCRSWTATPFPPLCRRAERGGGPPATRLLFWRAFPYPHPTCLCVVRSAAAPLHLPLLLLYFQVYRYTVTTNHMYTVYGGVYHTPFGRFPMDGISTVGIVSTPKMSALEASRRELSEDVPFGILAPSSWL